MSVAPLTRVVQDETVSIPILHIKTTAAQNEVVVSYHKARGLYFLAVVFVGTIELQSHRPRMCETISRVIEMLTI